MSFIPKLTRPRVVNFTNTTGKNSSSNFFGYGKGYTECRPIPGHANYSPEADISARVGSLEPGKISINDIRKIVDQANSDVKLPLSPLNARASGQDRQFFRSVVRQARQAGRLVGWGREPSPQNDSHVQRVDRQREYPLIPLKFKHFHEESNRIEKQIPGKSVDLRAAEEIEAIYSSRKQQRQGVESIIELEMADAAAKQLRLQNEKDVIALEINIIDNEKKRIDLLTELSDFGDYLAAKPGPLDPDSINKLREEAKKATDDKDEVFSKLEKDQNFLEPLQRDIKALTGEIKKIEKLEPYISVRSKYGIELMGLLEEYRKNLEDCNAVLPYCLKEIEDGKARLKQCVAEEVRVQKNIEDRIEKNIEDRIEKKFPGIDKELDELHRESERLRREKSNLTKNCSAAVNDFARAGQSKEYYEEKLLDRKSDIIKLGNKQGYLAGELQRLLAHSDRFHNDRILESKRFIALPEKAKDFNINSLDNIFNNPPGFFDEACDNQDVSRVDVDAMQDLNDLRAQMNQLAQRLQEADPPLDQSSVALHVQLISRALADTSKRNPGDAATALRELMELTFDELVPKPGRDFNNNPASLGDTDDSPKKKVAILLAHLPNGVDLLKRLVKPGENSPSKELEDAVRVYLHVSRLLEPDQSGNHINVDNPFLERALLAASHIAHGSIDDPIYNNTKVTSESIDNKDEEIFNDNKRIDCNDSKSPQLQNFYKLATDYRIAFGVVKNGFTSLGGGSDFQEINSQLKKLPNLWDKDGISLVNMMATDVGYPTAGGLLISHLDVARNELHKFVDAHLTDANGNPEKIKHLLLAQATLNHIESCVKSGQRIDDIKLDKRAWRGINREVWRATRNRESSPATRPLQLGRRNYPRPVNRQADSSQPVPNVLRVKASSTVFEALTQLKNLLAPTFSDQGAPQSEAKLPPSSVVPSVGPQNISTRSIANESLSSENSHDADDDDDLSTQSFLVDGIISVSDLGDDHSVNESSNVSPIVSSLPTPQPMGSLWSKFDNALTKASDPNNQSDSLLDTEIDQPSKASSSESQISPLVKSLLYSPSYFPNFGRSARQKGVEQGISTNGLFALVKPIADLFVAVFRFEFKYSKALLDEAAVGRDPYGLSLSISTNKIKTLGWGFSPGAQTPSYPVTLGGRASWFRSRESKEVQESVNVRWASVPHKNHLNPDLSNDLENGVKTILNWKTQGYKGPAYALFDQYYDISATTYNGSKSINHTTRSGLLGFLGFGWNWDADVNGLQSNGVGLASSSTQQKSDFKTNGGAQGLHVTKKTSSHTVSVFARMLAGIGSMQGAWGVQGYPLSYNRARNLRLNSATAANTLVGQPDGSMAGDRSVEYTDFKEFEKLVALCREKLITEFIKSPLITWPEGITKDTNLVAMRAVAEDELDSFMRQAKESMAAQTVSCEMSIKLKTEVAGQITNLLALKELALKGENHTEAYALQNKIDAIWNSDSSFDPQFLKVINRSSVSQKSGVEYLLSSQDINAAHAMRLVDFYPRPNRPTL